jgi:hypothetical protein
MKTIKKTEHGGDCVCDKCGKEAEFFHSRCCNAHFEGRLKDGLAWIACEECGKFVAFLRK